jgi:hypothetical protein
MINTTALATGIDIVIPECQLILHQPTLLEISYLGREKFMSGIYALNISKESIKFEDEIDLSEVSNFQLFMMVMEDERTLDKKEAVQEVLSLIFPKYKISFTPRSLMFYQQEVGMITVDENNFNILQEIISEVFCLNRGKEEEFNYNISEHDKRAKEIAEKLKRGRERVAAIKSQNAGDFILNYISILSVGLGLSMLAFKEYTLFMLCDQVERFGMYKSWDIDIKSRLAGAKIDHEPPDWMANIHKDIG